MKTKITKTMLYNHFDNIFAKRNDELYKVKEETTKRYIDTVIRKHEANIKDVITNLKKLQVDIAFFEKESGVEFNKWNGLGQVENLDPLRETKERIRHCLMHQLYGKSDYLDAAIKGHNKEESKISKEIADLKKLHQEIHNVIKSARTGKLAYRDLIALGVNMKDFQPEEAMLPAIVKLSVDPCIISSSGC